MRRERTGRSISAGLYIRKRFPWVNEVSIPEQTEHRTDAFFSEHRSCSRQMVEGSEVNLKSRRWLRGRVPSHITCEAGEFKA